MTTNKAPAAGKLGGRGRAQDTRKGEESRDASERSRGRPALPADERRARSIEVRLTDDELTLLRHLAERDGVTVSEWVRRAIRRP